MTLIPPDGLDPLTADDAAAVASVIDGVVGAVARERDRCSCIADHDLSGIRVRCLNRAEPDSPTCASCAAYADPS